jgi:hypothetical protein
LSLRDLDAGRDAQRGVEVGQRLVEQEDLGIAADGAADGDALALAARKGLGQPVEIIRRAAGFRQPRAPAVDLILALAAMRRPKAMLS